MTLSFAERDLGLLIFPWKMVINLVFLFFKQILFVKSLLAHPQLNEM